MTRDEQSTALYDWIVPRWHDRRHVGDILVQDFPAFMAKCAEIGLCRMAERFTDNYRDTQAVYVVTEEPEPPHEHDWIVSEEYGKPGHMIARCKWATCDYTAVKFEVPVGWPTRP